MIDMKPIHFPPPVADEMVRAILAGHKTVTRRVVNPQPRAIYYDGKIYDDDGLYAVAENQNGGVEQIGLPYRPGDIMYVQETWNYGYCDTTDFEFQYNETFFEELKPGSYKDSYLMPRYFYRTDDLDGIVGIKWRPSIHMPREAARIFLRVTNVRVERLKDITESQAIAEGCNGKFVGTGEAIGCGWEITPQDEFASIWDSTIKPADRALYGWEANPYVWVIEFERCEKPE